MRIKVIMKKDLAELLLAAGVDQQHIYTCQQEQATTGVPFEQCLLARTQVTPQILAQAYATYANFEYKEEITEAIADPALLARVPLRFLREHTVMPVMIDGSLVILTANPLLFQPLDELNLLLGGGARYMVSTAKAVTDAINRYYPIEGTKEMIAGLESEVAQEEIEGNIDFGDIEEKDILAMATEAPIIKLANHIFFQAVKREASDIHIEPYEKELHVRYRIDGVLHHIMTPPKRVQGPLISRIKIMADMNIAEKRIPQDGRIDLRVAGKPVDIRVSVLPVSFGERVVMRLLPKERAFAKIEQMGFSDRDQQVIMQSIERPNGIIFVTGPTGSGKTTTLYSILGYLNRPEVNIVTVEDPVEYQMPGIGQVQVRDKIGLTFAVALRSILRQDPDIIMIGETRDQETAQIAIRAALTGHLVLSTLHTNSAPATITRLLDMGVEPYLIASSVVLAVAQRLVRKLCAACKKVYTPPVQLLASVGITPEAAKKITFYTAVGCPVCNGTGYKGRIALFELMPITPAIARLTIDRADTGTIEQQAIHDGMITLLHDGVRQVAAGVTTLDEIVAAAGIQLNIVE